ncbi:MAG: anthranilate synthase component I family protein [Crocinitomicaceae bacterium]|nr:anthranilate synthase component I family protein [Crocinitomicaceae bacterium]
MMKFVDLPQKLSWKTILPKIEPNICCLLLRDDEHYLIGWGVKDHYNASDHSFTLKDFQDFISKHKQEYKLGYFGYDLKNVVEPQLSSQNRDQLGFPDTFWFIPENILICSGGNCMYSGKEDLNEILNAGIPNSNFQHHQIDLEPFTNKENYLKHVDQILQHIQRGDIYEVNYCVNFSSPGEIDPVQTFIKLNENAQAPFSSFFGFEGKHILSASPERFIQKTGDQLISQPIKGTARRDSDPLTDQHLANQLQLDKKERSENVMIVDLVRNDLSKLAKKNSVEVPELFTVHTFKTVHQLISTVQCEVKEGTTEADILNALFPMGSMTGAPKFSAMTIAEEQEDFKRGVYSGAIGVFHPNGNFDLNVVIRSILYNSVEKVISASVGGAITINSDPLSEYKECLIKLEALQKALC